MYWSTSQKTFFKRVVCLGASSAPAGLGLAMVGAFRQWGWFAPSGQSLLTLSKQFQAPSKSSVIHWFFACLNTVRFHGLSAVAASCLLLRNIMMFGNH
jgi:hypothetical protein